MGAAGVSLLGAQTATAATLDDPQHNCINGAPAGWSAAPAQKGDQFTVWAPPGYANRAADAAGEIRAKNFFGYYETKLGIGHLGFPGQTKIDIYLDPDLPSAIPNAAGDTEKLCQDSAAMVVDVWAKLGDAEEFHATLAHELFHAAQAAVAGGDFDDTWWSEATAAWAETRFGYDKPSPGNFATEVTDFPARPMFYFSQEHADVPSSHEYGAWTFVAWLFDRGKLNWTQLKQSFVQSAHTDATPVVDQLLGQSGIGGEVASYWADHLNAKPRFGPTAQITTIHDSDPTHVYHVNTAPYLAAHAFAIKPGAAKQQMALIIKKPSADVQVWVKTGDGAKDLYRVAPGTSFNETFCRTGATPGSYDLPKPGEVRIAITTTGKKAPPNTEIKVITSHEPCPKKILVIPGIAMGSLHLGMTAAEAEAAAPRHRLFAHVPTPFGEWQPGAFNVDGALVVAEFLDGRIAALFTGNSRARTTTGIRPAALQIPRYIPGTDDFDRPYLLPGSTLDQFGGSHCAEVKSTNPPDRYCWEQGPATRYTLAVAGEVNPCPVDAGDQNSDDDGDIPVCDYPKDWYIGGLAVATGKGLKLLHGLASLLTTSA